MFSLIGVGVTDCRAHFVFTYFKSGTRLEEGFA